MEHLERSPCVDRQCVVRLAPSDLPALPQSPHQASGNRDPPETQGLPMPAVRNAIHPAPCESGNPPDTKEPP